ncbi:alpha/beta fold hydrolase [Pacificimonas sp. WHA3]|uniref:Alpha/beta fold hydrolase n=1 Tax=Pacificimonas pallii TaxID=2827236 RepID=A0ABS6SGI9_9SPHN|nr:alpha/beta fold hydrolase [Pacificimonas pallii]MBV7257529.1 alpha/beta fold hydrolase [Pacificimonas pallii]
MTETPDPERLIDESYAATVEPERYDALMQAWDEFLTELNAAGSARFEDTVMPQHFARSQMILEQADRLRAAERTPEQLAEMTPGIGIVIDRAGTVLAANRNAIAVTACRARAALGESTLSAHAVRRLLTWTCERDAPPFLFVPCDIGNADAPECLLATQVESAATGPRSQYLLSAVSLRIDEAAAAAFGSAFSLSDAEAAVAASLGQGLQVAEIAERRGVSMHTVRTQVRQITQKTGANGIAGLIKMVCGFAANYAYSQAARSRVAPHLKPVAARRETSLRLSDGRSLAYVEHGDPDGRAVLFFHNMLYGCYLTDKCAAACVERGWRVIAISRPGFGLSDPVKAEGRELVAQVTRDARALLDHLDIGRVIAAGHAAGSLYAQHFALAEAARTRALMLISHAPYWDDRMMKALPPRQRLVARTTRHAPAALTFVVRAGTALIKAGKHDQFIEALHRDIPADMAALAMPDAYAAIVDGLRHTAAQGGGGFVKDCPLVLTDWSADGASLTVPVRIVLGDGDLVATAAYKEGYCRAVPHTQVTMVEGAGQYLLYSHWGAFLAALESLDEQAAA